MTADVVIAGGGPNGLLLACELRLADVRPLVLERLTERDATPKANGLVGRVVQALELRGLYERLADGSAVPRPLPFYQFSDLPLDLRDLPDNPLHALQVPQARIERVLEERARELGVEIRRGHELIAPHQEGDAVTLDVRAPRGAYSAVGGPGLNLGMQDAVNLGWKLAAQVRGWAPPGLLDTYEAERAPVSRRGPHADPSPDGSDASRRRHHRNPRLDRGTARRPGQPCAHRGAPDEGWRVAPEPSSVRISP